MPAMFPLTGAQVDLWFEQGTYDESGSVALTTNLTCTRGSSGYVQNLAGVWSSITTNTSRISDRGLLTEDANTNVVLWCRDLTNAAWTKSNMTAALTQTGIDGAANSATLLTATSANGTALQTTTVGSSLRTQSAHVKRITGSGTINMTMDNGTTWTAISPTSSYSQLKIPQQTLANPTVGFRIVTSGDAIAVDFVQNEDCVNGNVVSSPILTTTAAATRAADKNSFTGTAQSTLQTATALTFVTDQIWPQHQDQGFEWACVTDFTGGDIFYMKISPGGQISANVGASLTDGNTSPAPKDGNKATYAKDGTGRSLAGTGTGGVSGDAQSANVSTSPIVLGTDNYTGYRAYGYFRRCTIWNTRQSNATLLQLVDPTSSFYITPTLLFAQSCL